MIGFMPSVAHNGSNPCLTLEVQYQTEHTKVVRYLVFGNLLSEVAGVVMGRLKGFMRLIS
ncbi:hypothetical protein HanXRQr2_Chr17g0825161 [Helianthus annuus]|uniref:Uncharacterized protein n=1 Tax=Helianthus annuus TaxID=4232 RepID=A0A9K3GVU5_HELAN|nr:hypothetical protein HanXRQr2_Chr17g0825161 [Helianthus annuus]KAJ0814986.1 hypothetical protein HanPSC8_Chr17g0792151 [Helianthus annuus]